MSVVVVALLSVTLIWGRCDGIEVVESIPVVDEQYLEKKYIKFINKKLNVE